MDDLLEAVGTELQSVRIELQELNKNLRDLLMAEDCFSFPDTNELNSTLKEVLVELRQANDLRTIPGDLQNRQAARLL